MAHIKIDQWYKTYSNDEGNFHREDGPAVIWKAGGIEYWVDGKYANSYNLAPDVSAEGDVMWGGPQHAIHSINRPAWDSPSGCKRWYNNGVLIWPELK